MGNVQITIAQFQIALDSIEKELEKRSEGDVPNISLKEMVYFILECLKNNIESIDDNKILLYAVDEIITSWKALSSLYPEPSLTLHCRKILECSVIVRFLLESPDKLAKYSQKWNLYKDVTMFSAWAKLDFENLSNEMDKNIQIMSSRYLIDYKKYEIFFSSKKNIKLTGVLINDLHFFGNVKSWLSPKSFEDILNEDSEKRITFSYYTWWSNSIHFSPVNQLHYQVETDYGTFIENSYFSIILEISVFLQKVSAHLKSDKYYEKVARIFFFRYLKEKLIEDPDMFLSLIEKLPIIVQQPLCMLAVNKIDATRYLDLTLEKDVKLNLSEKD